MNYHSIACSVIGMFPLYSVVDLVNAYNVRLGAGFQSCATTQPSIYFIMPRQSQPTVSVLVYAVSNSRYSRLYKAYAAGYLPSLQH